MDDAVAPHQREEALEQLQRPEKPGELSPRAEVIVALRAVQSIQDSPLAAQVDPTQYIPAIGNVAVRLGEAPVTGMQGAQDGHTLVYGGEEEIFLSDERPAEELTPAEKRVVRLALEWQAGSDRPDFRDEAVDMLKHGVMFAGN